MKKTLLAASLLLSTTLTSAFEVRDPQNLIPVIDTYTQEMSFEESFKLGDKTILEEHSCTYFNDESFCANWQTTEEVIEVNEDGAIIERFIDGEVSKEIIEKDRFIAARGNVFRYYNEVNETLNNSLLKANISKEENPGDIEIRSITLLKADYKTINYLGKVKDAIEVTFYSEICSEECTSTTQKVEIVKNMPYLAQMKSYIWDFEFAKGSQEVTKFTRK